MKRKAIIFPYNAECASLVRNRELLLNHEIVACVSPIGYGLQGKDAAYAYGGENTGIVISDKKISEINFDDLLVCESSSDFDTFIMPQVKLAAECGKNVIFLYNISQQQKKEAEETCKKKNVKCVVLTNRRMDTDKLFEHEIIPLSVPVVFVASVIENTNKFDVQLGLRKFLQEEGYKVSQIGTNVRLIYKLFLEGKGYTSIAKYLNEQGIMSPLMYLKSLGYQQNVKTNGVWTKTTVKSILTNQAYIGSAVHGKVVIEKYNNIPLHATDPSEWVIVENTHEPLVDKETFEKAQERVKEISDAYFAKEFTKHPPNEKNLLKGKIVCGDCGKGMRLSPRTTKSYVYFCGTFSDGINPACSRHKIDQEDVNKAVFAQISNHMRCCIDALRVIRELNARSSGLKKYDVYEKAITRQRRELEKVNRKFSELYGDYSEHLINESEYLTLKQQYLLKSEALKKEIDNLLISQNLYSKNYKIDADWENLINKYLKCRKLNKELADAFVDKVQVFEGGRISVNLVYDDCLEELLQVKNKREGDLNE